MDRKVGALIESEAAGGGGNWLIGSQHYVTTVNIEGFPSNLPP